MYAILVEGGDKKKAYAVLNQQKEISTR